MSNPYSTPTSDDPAQQVLVQGYVRANQIVTAGLCMGVLIFMGIVLTMQQGRLDGEPDILSWMGIGAAVMMYANHLIIPRLLQAVELKKLSAERIREVDDAERWNLIAPIYRTRHIIGSAILEGAAFFNLVAYMVEPFAGNLIAAAVLLVVLALKIPTATRMQFWVQDRARELELS